MGGARRRAAAPARQRRLPGARDALTARAFAGRYAPAGGGDDRALVEALRREGAATVVAAPPFAVAATGGGAGATGEAVVPTGGSANGGASAAGSAPSPLCVLDGRPRLARLAGAAGLEPSLPPEPLVAGAFARLGEGVLDHLDGEFALAVWDPAGARGLVARDRSAARGLFLAERRGELLFGSEVRTLLALLPVRPAPDGAALLHWLARSPLPGDRTLFDSITRLRGGHAVRLADGRWERFAFHRPAYVPPRALDADAAAAELREGLEAAVDRALEGAERPGVMLSGGLDSAAVAAAAVASGVRPTAYSGVFPDRPEVDESPRIARVRDWLELPAVEAELGGGSALAAAAAFVAEWDLPPASPNRFVWSPLLERAAADGVDVMLDGEGGDELFGCARYLVADVLRSRGPAAAARLARRLPGMGAHPRPRWIGRALLVYGARALLPPALHERLRSVRGRERGPAWMTVPVSHDRWGWKRLPGPRWWAQLATALGDDPLGAADQQRRDAAMAGLALRHPLRDPALIDLVLRLPPEFGYDPELDRPLARRALRGQLPPEALAPARKPFFNSLLEASLGGPDAPRLRELLHDLRPELAARVRGDAVVDLPEVRADAWALDSWRAATLELWLRHIRF